MNVAINEDLLAALGRRSDLAVAVSGGVDSVTLAVVAARHAAGAVRMFHAVSPAVPVAATALVRKVALREGWDLHVIDAGEFGDPAYRANPVDRCYFCKTNLYARIRACTDAVIASGTNLDDLGDYRPGLVAAREKGVVHPYVEAGLAKADVRSLARRLGLGPIAELPAQPCLSSRVETGIAIQAADLQFIDAIEREAAALAPTAAALRCRVRQTGIVLEVDGVGEEHRPALEGLLRDRCEAAGRSLRGVEPYRRSSAFLRPS